MSTWTSDFVESNDLRIHYRRSGGDKPPLILAHGFSDDGGCWPRVASVLADDYDVIALDARGHGLSADPPTGYGQMEHAADLAGLIQALGLRQPIVLGHSMGAVNALALAGVYPQLPRAILLEDPPAFWQPVSPEEQAASAERRAGMDAWIISLKRKTHVEIMAMGKQRDPGWSDEEFGPWADAKLRFSFQVLNRGGAPLDWPATLRQITCPALLLKADPVRGGIITDESAASLRALVPQLQIAHIAAAGHSIRRDQFTPYMQVVTNFLRSLA
jgi:pimeloyl-ACP methyl ester carboxylesterase